MRGDQLQRYLKKNVTQRVSLTLDDDRREVVKTQSEREDTIGLTLHGSFLDAPTRVLRALVRFLRRPEPHLRRRVVRLYRQTGLHRVGGPSGASRRIVLRHRGRYFDLKEVFDDLNRRHFDGEVRAFITWGRRTRAKSRSRSIHFGSYNWDRRVIRIHPDLDRGFVPRYFLESVLFHEMLHVKLGIAEGRNGRRSSHTAEFRRREKVWPTYERAKAWERANLHRFLRPLHPRPLA
jgi:predicted metal-dependent hydrolase